MEYGGRSGRGDTREEREDERKHKREGKREQSRGKKRTVPNEPQNALLRGPPARPPDLLPNVLQRQRQVRVGELPDVVRDAGFKADAGEGDGLVGAEGVGVLGEAVLEGARIAALKQRLDLVVGLVGLPAQALHHTRGVLGQVQGRLEVDEGHEPGLGEGLDHDDGDGVGARGDAGDEGVEGRLVVLAWGAGESG